MTKINTKAISSFGLRISLGIGASVIRHFHVASNRKPYHKPAARSRRWRLPFYTAAMRFNECLAQRESQTSTRDGGIEGGATIELGENPRLVFGQNSNASILRLPHRFAILLP